MKEKVLPLRFSILEILTAAPKGMTPAQLYDQLHDKYPKEKQCQLNTIDGHLMSMKGVGLLEVSASSLNGDKLVSVYVITDYGKSRIGEYVKLT